MEKQEITLLNGKIRIHATEDNHWKWQVRFEEKTTSYDNEPEMWYEVVSRLEKRRLWSMEDHFAIMEKDDKIHVVPSRIVGEYVREHLRNGWDLIGSFNASDGLVIYRSYNDDFGTAVYLLDPSKVRIIKFQNYYSIYEKNESHFINLAGTLDLDVADEKWQKVETVNISDLPYELFKEFQGNDRWFNPEIISGKSGIEIPENDRLEVGSWRNSNNWGIYYVRHSDFEKRVGIVEKQDGDYDIGCDNKVEKALEDWKNQKVYIRSDWDE